MEDEDRTRMISNEDYAKLGISSSEFKTRKLSNEELGEVLGLGSGSIDLDELLGDDNPIKEGKTIYEGEAYNDAGIAFCESLGGKVGITEEESRLSLNQVNWSMIEKWKQEGSERASGVTIERFEVIDEGDLKQYCKLYTELLNQVPKEDLEWELKTKVENLGIKDKVIFRTEFISEQERIKHYAAADCVVFPSLYEPFGIVCTESMSMAKPTVVGARGTNGFREQIISEGEKKCGIHINPYDIYDIAWGVKQILKLEDKGKKMGKIARERVIENFSWDIVTKRTLNIYKEFI